MALSKSSRLACLIAVNPTNGIGELALPEAGILIGSDPGNDLVIGDETVSRRHATINFRGDRYEVTDLASTNGTFINNRRVTDSMPIKAGDEIRFGQARFVLWFPGTASRSEERKGSPAFSRRASLALFALTIVLSVVSGFLAGAVAATRSHGDVVARQFVLVNQEGKPRSFLTVFPQPGDPKCPACDGKAHLVVFGRQGEAVDDRAT